MSEKPIIFSAPMVRAIIDGRKTQTRRIVKQQPSGAYLDDALDGKWLTKPFAGLLLPKIRDLPIHCPHGQLGTRLWVRETWSHDAESLAQCRAAHEDVMGSGTYGPYYRATEVAPDTLKWITPIFMPRWASRITLEITGVRVELVQEISGDDAFAEGVEIPCTAPQQPLLRLTGNVQPSAYTTKHPRDWTIDDYARFEYAELFESINGTGSWEKNPWVFVLDFRRIEP